MGLAKAATTPGRPAAFPLLYLIDQVAHRYGIAPWLFESDDPDISRWLQRGLLFQSFESQAREGKS